jgi:FkbH-like protein
MVFVLRNSTIENLFGSTDVIYSGYGDISYIDPVADVVIWFYLVPFKPDSKILSNEIDSYFDSLELVYQKIGLGKTFVIFTLQNLFVTKYQSTDIVVDIAIAEFNRKVWDFAIQHSNVKIIEFGEFIKRYMEEQMVDWKYYFISKMQINPKLGSEFKKWFAHKLDEIQLKRKKCLVLDLDNTLWGGVLGEDGGNGIKIGSDYPGNAFLLFQEYLVELSKNGVILTVCSKNNEQDVLDVWEQNPYIKLKKEHISAYRINWRNKADNIKELAEELNIGLDSMVFVDDSPTERELVKQILPMVKVPDFPNQPYMLPAFAVSLIENYFRTYILTPEDKNKTEQYKANSQRAESQKKFNDFSGYLISLEMELTIETANPYTISRIAQMTQKTNQFNLTTQRYTDTDIQRFVDSGDKVYCLSVKDKFGDSGITGCIILKNGKSKKEMSIDSLLLSCRILGKGIEKVFVNKVLSILKSEGFEQVEANYIPTQKNAQVADFYDRIGFDLQSDNGEKKYSIELSKNDFKIESYFHISVI